MKKITSPRRRRNEVKAVQTEASFPPECQSIESELERYASDQFRDLVKLRDVIHDAMKELACSVYDVNAFKDVLFKIEEDLPSTLPLTDMLLLTSKLFRRATNLDKLLSCFFGVVFAEGHCDERFHFTELRTLRHELYDLKERFAKSEEERKRLQRLLDEAGRVALNHCQRVIMLETRNSALRLQTIALEDQMALLFSQLNKDMQRQYREAYDMVNCDIDAQDQSAVTMETFRQSMETLNDQLRHSRALISEVREAVTSGTHGAANSRNLDLQMAKDSGIRFKLKQVESNFQQIVARFAAIKGVVTEASYGLMTALQDRKNVLFLSLQHIRLYDIQSNKMRRGKAHVVEMKRVVTELLQRMNVTFPAGVVTVVDRVGRISTHKLDLGQNTNPTRNRRSSEKSTAESTGARDEGAGEAVNPAGRLEATETSVFPHTTLSAMVGNERELGDNVVSSLEHYAGTAVENLKIPFPSVYNAYDLLISLDQQMEDLNSNMSFENEVNTFLKTLTLALPTTPRTMDEALAKIHDEYQLGRALLPTAEKSDRVIPSMPDMTAGMERKPSTIPATSVTTDGSDRSKHTEKSKEAITVGTDIDTQKVRDAQEAPRLEFTEKLAFVRQVYETRIADLEAREAELNRKLLEAATPAKEKRGGSKKKEAGRKATSVTRGRTEQQEVTQTRTEWQKAKTRLQGNRRIREAMMKQIGKVAKENGDFLTQSDSEENAM
ncbi:hypothetical protein ERJ75_001822800 [Trypanosoma vivax]|nr:hypothetical protein ERJ75_001822800 [Trypanosoma vivax]